VELYRTPFFENGDGATVEGSQGASLVAGLVPAPGDLVLPKYRFSAFFHTHLDLILRRMGTKLVAICGVQTPNCIRATAFDAVCLDYDVLVLADATASASEEVQQANLHDLRQIQVGTPTVKEWGDAL
jgi:nicotinamidase-related amidase